MRRRRGMRGSLLVAAIAWATLTHASRSEADGRASGWIALEGRAFVKSPLADEQHGSGLSIAARPEGWWRSDDGSHTLSAAVFGRIDQHDAARTHADLRELLYVFSGRRAEVRAGVGRVFWGVTESVHLVDVINSTDGVENPDGEDKLGQPMLALHLIGGAGNLALYVLPGFREPTYPGAKGRLRPPLPIERDRIEYEAADAERHVDWAARWSHSLGPFDLGLSQFSGTAREARFRADTSTAGRPVLIPIHDLVDQTGLDTQATFGGWLFKLEVVSVGRRGGRHTAASGGFEYTVPGAFGTVFDLGLLAEYLYDDRGKSFASPFDHDLFTGVRLAFNDIAGSSILAGSITDLDNGTNAVLAEASTRVRDGLTLELEVRASVGASPEDPLYAFRRDAYVQASLTRYF